MSDRSRKEYTQLYKYDERGNKIEMVKLDDSGNQVFRTEYVWQQQRERLSQVKYYDENDHIVKWLAKRYEIYHTTDRRQRVIDY